MQSQTEQLQPKQLQPKQSQPKQLQPKQSQSMQAQSSKVTFWNNLIRWVKAFDSTARHHQYKTEQNRLMRRDSALQEVSGQAGNVETGVTVRQVP